eukprot:CAMPEP_0175545084 /NCGR_PEP_ID=MMETSP0096-20121207/29104_1 /TAXON_ID=311494 /ORGANISM="Alexandrium monilatum, Strain CCMP3105" /LENGTH=264 /DNA_ID=CAMNT_0016848045 /DNA_START=15 /DNA_END=809 /DNA_ORIENTATION=+
MARRADRRRRLLPALPLAAAACWLIGGPGFIPAAGHQQAPMRGQAAMRHAVPRYQEDTTINDLLYPPEQMWQTNKEGTVLREVYPGARDFTSTFWALVQPAASAGFLIVGISSYFGEPIVNWNPVTAKLLSFLSRLDGINWLPQGAFMTFYGFFGLFLFGPLQWYLVGSNKGEGLAEFNKQTKRFTIVRDGETLRDMSFDDIDIVKMEWTNLAALGAREIYVIAKDGEQVHFMDGVEELPKRVLEKRASQLATFLGKDLDVEDY